MSSNYTSLNAKVITSYLDPNVLSYLNKIECLECVDSTNNYLLSKAKSGEKSGFFCFAEFQTQGRGRLGRVWTAEKAKNLCFSLLWRSQTLNNSSLSIAIAVMVANALKKLGIKVQLKWPNDVLLEGRKLAGILLEANEKQSVVIGIGLNVFPSDTEDRKRIFLQEVVKEPLVRNELAALLINELLSGLGLFEKEGLSPFLNSWQQLDFLAEREISIQLSQKIYRGIAKGLNQQGELILLEPNGQAQFFSYGEASLTSNFTQCTE